METQNEETDKMAKRLLVDYFNERPKKEEMNAIDFISENTVHSVADINDNRVSENTVEPVSDKVGENTVEPVSDKVGENTVEPVSDKVGENTVEPVSDIVGENTVEPVSDIVGENTVEPVSDKVGENTVEPVSDKVGENTVEPVSDKVGENTVESVSDKVGENTVESESDKVGENTVEFVSDKVVSDSSFDTDSEIREVDSESDSSLETDLNAESEEMDLSEETCLIVSEVTRGLNNDLSEQLNRLQIKLSQISEISETPWQEKNQVAEFEKIAIDPVNNYNQVINKFQGKTCDLVLPTENDDQDDKIVKQSEEKANKVHNDQAIIINDSRDLLKIMAEWNPDWMFRNGFNNNENDSSLILSKSDLALRVLPDKFASFKESKNSFVPLLLHEIWSSIYKNYEDKRNIDVLEIVSGLGNRVLARDERFSLFFMNAAIRPSEKELDIVRKDCFVSVKFKERISGNPFTVFGLVTEVVVPNHQIYSWCLNRVQAIRHNDNATIPVRYKILTKKLTPDEVLNLGVESKTDVVNITVNFLSPIGTDLTKADCLINLSSTSLGRDLINPSAEILSFPKIGGLLHADIRYLFALSKLNKIQKEVVVGVSDACLKYPVQNKVCLVQGPPGTGKSSTICGILLQILATYGLNKIDNRRPRILVCAPSNAAVDSICMKLIDIKLSYPSLNSVKFVRFGVPDKTQADVQRYCFQEAVNPSHAGEMQVKLNQVRSLAEEANSTKREGWTAKEEGDEVQQKKFDKEYEMKMLEMQTFRAAYRGEEMYAKKILMRHADIILTTLASSYHPVMREFFQGCDVDRKISVCIIDEAGQCVEPEALIPLQYNMNKLVLVGDHKQLPATVISRTAKDHRYDSSLFKRLFTSSEQLQFQEDQNSGVMLTTQYRMHPNIAAWPNKYFYSGCIHQGVTHPEIKLAPYTLIDSNTIQTVLNGAICNMGEVSLVKEAIIAVKNIIGVHSKLNIGVITFYRWQTEKLSQMVKGENWTDVEVNTVDGFQGAEKDIIIISSVRSGNSIGFLTEGERLNVALTRAKRSLILIANVATFQRKQMWKQLINDAYSRNVVFTPGAQTMESILGRSGI